MSTDQFQLDTTQDSAALNFVEGIRKAKKSGKGMAAMIREIAKLRMGRGRLRPDEYFMYGLYDDSRFTPEAKQTFLSQYQILLDSPWRIVAKDKPLMTAMLAGLGLPVPETQAIIHPTRTCAGALTLRSRDEVGRFLREQAQYPIFGKPFDSACSVGTAKIESYDRKQDAVVIGNDQLIPINTFADSIDALGNSYLFQTLMLPHDAIAELIGPSVSSVRMFVISDDEGCSLFRASWKIPATVNDADNFWRPGNMLAGIDVETGRIVRTLIRTESGGTEPIEAHPVTGAKFGEQVFPMWDQMRQTVLAAAVNLPGCHFQGWDVALTDRGPILVELEGDGGNPIMEQLCFESGLLTERYKRVIEQAEQREKNRRKVCARQDQALFKKSLAALAIPRSESSTSSDQSPATDESVTDEPTTPAVMPVLDTDALESPSVTA